MQPPRRRRFVFADRPQRGRLRSTDERHGSRQQQIQNRPQPVDVGRRADLANAPAGLFGRHILHRSQQRPALRVILGLRGELRQAEVGQPRREIVRVQQHVARFDVPVQYALGMRVRQRVGQRCDDARGDPRLKRFIPRFQKRLQRATRAILRSQIVPSVDPAGFVHGHDVGMAQARSGPPLPQKPFAHPLDVQQRRPRQLQRHLAIEHRVLREIHHAEPARPQPPQQTEPPHAVGWVSGGGRRVSGDGFSGEPPGEPRAVRPRQSVRTLAAPDFPSQSNESSPPNGSGEPTSTGSVAAGNSVGG